MLKKADIAVFCCILTACLVAALVVLFSLNTGKSVVIKQENTVLTTLSLSKDTVYKLEHNTVVIKDGKAYVESADCPDQICVKHKKIYKAGESIVCLPNRVIIEVK